MMRLILHPYRARAPESACACVRVCLWVHVSPARAGLTESLGRVNGIRLTCVIQLVCGREVCPHPSAGGDKEPGGGGARTIPSFYWEFYEISISVCLPRTDLCLSFDNSKKLTL